AGLTPTYRVPAPHTWREVLQTLDQHVPLANLTVALQEYGQSNVSLIAGLEARGARVIPVPVYRWDLPQDLQPLVENLRALAAGRRDVLLFTAAQQVTNVLRVAQEQGLAAAVQERLDEVLVGSVGPSTSARLRECGWPVDVEPEQPQLGPLVATAAQRSR